MKNIYVRKWLNKDKSLEYTGFIYWSVYFPRKEDGWIDARFEVADCSRKISLSLDTSDKYIKNSIDKLQLIADEAIKCKEALLKAYQVDWNNRKAKENESS